MMKTNKNKNKIIALFSVFGVLVIGILIIAFNVNTKASNTNFKQLAKSINNVSLLSIDNITGITETANISEDDVLTTIEAVSKKENVSIQTNKKSETTTEKQTTEQINSKNSDITENTTIETTTEIKNTTSTEVSTENQTTTQSNTTEMTTENKPITEFTTEQPISTEKPFTTQEPSTEKPSTTEKPNTTERPTSTEKPSTTQESTTEAPKVHTHSWSATIEESTLTGCYDEAWVTFDDGFTCKEGEYSDIDHGGCSSTTHTIYIYTITRYQTCECGEKNIIDSYTLYKDTYNGQTWTN